MKNNYFGINLKSYRETTGINQDAISKFLDVDCSTISHWETGLYEPNFDTLKKLAKLFDVTVDNLIEEV